MIEGIRSWKNGEVYNQNDPIFMSTTAVVHSQTRLGWRQLVEGTLAIEWWQSQAAYFQTMQNPTSVLTWISQVIVYFWELVFVV